MRIGRLIWEITSSLGHCLIAQCNLALSGTSIWWTNRQCLPVSTLSSWSLLQISRPQSLLRCSMAHLSPLPRHLLRPILVWDVLEDAKPRSIKQRKHYNLAQSLESIQTLDAYLATRLCYKRLSSPLYFILSLWSIGSPILLGSGAIHS